MQPATTEFLRAPAKVNLNLRLLGVRPDGYHQLETLFLPLPGFADTLAVSPTGTAGGIELTCSVPGLSGPENLVAKAYRAYGAATGFAPGLAVHLEKRIPAGAGLGGGSSDAASLLAWLNRRAGERALAPDTLSALAAKLGADVPFFLLGGPALASGIGEVLTPVSFDMSGFSLVLVCPPVHVSTAWAYREWDRLNPGARFDPEKARGLLTAPGEQIICPFCPGTGALQNSLETAVFPAFPALRAIKERLIREGAVAALMSGSGASLFGLFRDHAAAAEAERRFGRESLPARCMRL